MNVITDDLIRVKFTGVMAPPALATVIRNAHIIIGGRVIILQLPCSFCATYGYIRHLRLTTVDIENLCAFRVCFLIMQISIEINPVR